MCNSLTLVTCLTWPIMVHDQFSTFPFHQFLCRPYAFVFLYSTNHTNHRLSELFETEEVRLVRMFG